MIGLRLLIAAVAIATVAYIWNTLSYSIPVPVVTTIESAYDYIIGTFGLKYLLKMLPLHRCNIQKFSLS